MAIAIIEITKINEVAEESNVGFEDRSYLARWQGLYWEAANGALRR